MRLYLYILLKTVVIMWLLLGCNSNEKNSTASITTSPLNDKTKITLSDRSYYIATPNKNFDPQKSYKLLLAFHGSMQGAKSMRSLTKFEFASDNYIVVYPQSKVEEWNEGCHCNKPYRLGIDDLRFVEDVVADVKKKFNIIDDELYAVGFSQGGLFTQNLMCNSKLNFNSIASVASPMSDNLSLQCQIEHSTNYLMVHGKKDTTLPFEGLIHTNFGLISSESAIRLIAKENNIDSDVEFKKSNDISTYTFKNQSHINQLVAIEDGGHSWAFTHFDTTKQVINFFDSVSKKKFDKHTSLYRIEKEHSKDVHVRSMGLDHSGPAIILLSGFNKNYHSDSAWYSLLQPLIARTNRVHVIERYGNGFSSLVEQPSYASFATALDKTLAILNEDEFIMVSFASANILAHVWQNSQTLQVTDHLKGMVWIDPDILLPHSIALYQDWPVSWYREAGDALIEHIQQGNWTQKTLDKLSDERSTINELIPLDYKDMMDWSYFDLISQGRADIDKQLIRAKEIINYHDDLASLLGSKMSTSIPITVIDTDFESHDIKNAEPEYLDTLLLWQQEGSQWSQFISKASGGQYVPLKNSDHMAVFQHPDEIIKTILHLENN